MMFGCVRATKAIRMRKLGKNAKLHLDGINGDDRSDPWGLIVTPMISCRTSKIICMTAIDV